MADVAVLQCCTETEKGRSGDRNRPLTSVELRGFEPLTPSMRTRSLAWPNIADCRSCLLYVWNRSLQSARYSLMSADDGSPIGSQAVRAAMGSAT
jgi:hypothetical protein